MPDIKKNGDQLSSQLVPSVLFMNFTIPTKVIMVDCINVLGQLIKGETFTVARYFWEN